MKNVHNVQVFCMINSHVDELKDLENKEIRLVWQGGAGKKVPRTQILCEIEEEMTQRGIEELYRVFPSIDLPERITKFFFQIQAVEYGMKNHALVVCDSLGRKLPAEWTKDAIAGFRTVHEQIFVVDVSSLRDFGTVYSYRLEQDGKEFFLVRKRLGMDFRVTEITINREEEIPNIKWTDDTFDWIEGENETETKALRAEAKTSFTAAAVAAYQKANHNCFREGCGPHYAITDGKAKQVYWAERRNEKGDSKNEASVRPVEKSSPSEVREDEKKMTPTTA